MSIKGMPSDEIPTIGGLVPMFIPDNQPRIPVFFPLAPGHQPTVSALYRLNYQEPAMLTLHSVHGPYREESDISRFQAIARTRNLIVDRLKEMEERREIGIHSFIWIQDYDVGILPGVIYHNYIRMWESEDIGALAVDYQAHGGGSGIPEVHVALGAVLWRWRVLREITFKWDAKQSQNCDCMNACIDVRKIKVPGTRKKYRIEYAPGAYAQHYEGSPGTMFFGSKQDAEKVRNQCIEDFNKRQNQVKEKEEVG